MFPYFRFLIMLCAGGDSLFCPCSWKTACHPIPWWDLSRSSCAICCWPGGEGECQRGKTLGICIATSHDWSDSTPLPRSNFYIRCLQSAPMRPEICISAILPGSDIFYHFYHHCFLHYRQSYMAFWTLKVASPRNQKLGIGRLCTGGWSSC